MTTHQNFRRTLTTGRVVPRTDIMRWLAHDGGVMVTEDVTVVVGE